MKLIKLTALSLLLFAFLTGITSCEKNAEKKKTTDYQKTGIVISGAQVYPASASAALGSMDVFYTKETRILTYTINWSGLSGAVTSMHVHGLAPAGFSAPAIVQTLSTSGIVKCPTITVTTCGSITGTLLADGVVIKEDDILNGNYYVDIHTSGYPNGEIRAQIRFQ